MDDSYFSGGLLETPPTTRAAYSDRMAWIMAELSRLVYEPLPKEVTIKTLVEEIKKAVAQGHYENTVEALITKAIGKNVLIDQTVINVLKKANFEFLDSFAIQGTEAMLVKLQPKDDFSGFIALTFRGTEMNVTDIMSDLKLQLVSAPGGGRVHRGFLEAFLRVESQIKISLQEHNTLPLYITGHSLGGALAMVATCYLNPNGNGATYTYGCPRVADDEFYKSVKTPVYRLVNAADIVPRVPFGFVMNFCITFLRMIPINGTKILAEWFRRNFLGYTHHGNMVFLSAPPNIPDENGIPFKGLKVVKSPDIFWRITVVITELIKTRWKAGGNNHMIHEYSQKLNAYAQRRNPKTNE